MTCAFGPNGKEFRDGIGSSGFYARDMAAQSQDRISGHARSGQSIELERVHYEWSRVFANRDSCSIDELQLW